MVSLLTSRLAFPNPESADDEGLVAVGGDLSTARLLLAYRSGIFPWSVHPLTWWSPDPRGIFELDSFHVPRSLERVLRQGQFKVTVNQAFREVIQGCAASAPGRRTTWISPEFIEAYTKLHTEGHANSVECWQDDKLAGGIYGVSVGGLFAGESMFYRVSNASKVALVHLLQRLKERQYKLFDVQMVTPLTSQLGAIEIPRETYLKRLRTALAKHPTFA